MAVKVSLSHITEFNYDRFVCLSPQIVRLKPAPHCRTPISSYSLKIEPSSNFINWQQDPNSNHLARIVFKSPTKKFKITVGLIAEMISINAFDFFLEDCAVNFPFFYDVNLKKELIPFLELSDNGPNLSAYIKKFQYRNGRTIDFLVEINKILQESIKYVVRLEPGIQDCEKTLASREGSCRDTAWLLVNILRQLGFASRFVSGYLIQLT
ncbi:transglutaminase family protein, partial [bacterium]|nr:transglutaminase family protein [bacterium]